MITKNKSEKVNQLKYLILIPILFGMLVYTSCSKSTEINFDEIEQVLKEEIPNSGRYMDGTHGKMFIGNQLNGKVVPLNEYTRIEKELSLHFNENVRSIKGINLSVVVDKNGDRVLFLYVPMPPMKNKASDKIVIEDDGSISFSKIEEVPIFPGCEGTEEELRQCLQENITKHVNINFNAELANELDLEPGIKRIFVMFKIDKEGNVTDVQARAPHQSLADEAIRVINSLPKMIPGKMKGKNVGVKYSLPIAFKVE